jgi:hypothetical protein
MLLNEEAEMLEQLIFFLTHGYIDSKYACLLPSEEIPDNFDLWLAFRENTYFLEREYAPEFKMSAFGQFLHYQNRQSYVPRDFFDDMPEDLQEAVPEMIRIPTPVTLTPEQELGIKIALGDPQCTDLAIDILQRGH